MLSVHAPHLPTFLLTVSCESVSAEGGRTFLGVEIVSSKPSSATQQLFWQGKFSSDTGQVQFPPTYNGEKRVSSLPLPQFQTRPTSRAVLGPQEDFYDAVRLLCFSSNYLSEGKNTGPKCPCSSFTPENHSDIHPYCCHQDQWLIILVQPWDPTPRFLRICYRFSFIWECYPSTPTPCSFLEPFKISTNGE